jgi:hypothetical protein
VLEQRIKVVSEVLARSMSRRTFVGRVGGAVTSGIAGLALGVSLNPDITRAAGSKGPTIPEITCSPPGPYCNTGGGTLSGCHGGHCYHHLYNGQVLPCRVYYQYYAAGCWTSGDGWTCCDCECLQNGVRVTTCGCAQSNQSPTPLAE